MSADKPTTIIAALLLSCIGVYAIMAGPIMTEVLVAALGLPPDTAGQIFAVEALGTALAPLAATLWMGRVRWRTAAILAILVVVAGNVVSSYQTSAGALTALRFAVGFLGQGTAFTLAIGIISGTAQKDRNFAFLIAAQVTLGVLCFLLLPMSLPGFEDGGIGGVLLPLAALALLTLATVGWIPQPGGATAGHHAAAASGGSSGPAFIALAVMLIWCTGLGAIWAFVKLIGTSAGIDPAQVGVALGISTGVATVGALTASWLADRVGRIIPVTIGVAGSGRDDRPAAGPDEFSGIRGHGRTVPDLLEPDRTLPDGDHRPERQHRQGQPADSHGADRRLLPGAGHRRPVPDGRRIRPGQRGRDHLLPAGSRPVYPDCDAAEPAAGQPARDLRSAGLAGHRRDGAQVVVQGAQIRVGHAGVGTPRHDRVLLRRYPRRARVLAEQCDELVATGIAET